MTFKLGVDYVLNGTLPEYFTFDRKAYNLIRLLPKGGEDEVSREGPYVVWVNVISQLPMSMCLNVADSKVHSTLEIRNPSGGGFPRSEAEALAREFVLQHTLKEDLRFRLRLLDTAKI